MKRVLLLLLVALITFGLILLYKNPKVLSDIWLWIVGLAGSIIHLAKLGVNYVKEKFPNSEEKEVIIDPEDQPKTIKKRNDINIQLLRYYKEDDTTIGLLYIDDRFFCYTIEDVLQKENSIINHRIPQGVYTINFDKNTNSLTEKYRGLFPEWFTYHLQLKETLKQVPTYIHYGGNQQDHSNSILVSNSLSVDDHMNFLNNSKNAFRTLYQFLSQELERNKTIMLTIKDESWASTVAS